MSKIFKRPMFRKGGNVGTGIMTGITDRVEAQDGFFGTAPNPLDIPKTTSDPFQGLDFNFQTPKVTMPEARELSDIIGEREKALMGATEYKSADPLTKFLLTFGPAYATETRGGGGIGRALAASQEPIKEMLKDKQREADFKRAIRLKAVESGISTKEALDKEIRQAKNLRNEKEAEINNAVRSAKNKIISDANLSEQEQKLLLKQIEKRGENQLKAIRLTDELTNQAEDKFDNKRYVAEYEAQRKEYASPQVAESATDFFINDETKFREKVGTEMYGGILPMDISQLDEGQRKKQLKNFKNKFVFDPFEGNYKFINYDKNTKKFTGSDIFNTIEEINVDTVTEKTDKNDKEEKKSMREDELAISPLFKRKSKPPKKLKEVLPDFTRPEDLEI